jgi:ABC-2 type transport system ATP-binding protein
MPQKDATLPHRREKVRALKVQNLSKAYRLRGREIPAVSNLSFSLEEGQILGLLGPNGAGKSTTMRMLTTLARPDSGTARIAGYDVARNPLAVRSRIGYVPQAGSLMHASVVREELVFQGRAFGLSTHDALTQGKELLHFLGAEDLLDRKAGTLSGGQRRRVDIAIGLISHPVVAFLDEPTVGLDPESRRDLWQLVGEIRERWGTTVVITTHYVQEVESLADQIVIMEGGRVIVQGGTSELVRRFSTDTVRLTMDAAIPTTLLTEIEGWDNVVSACAGSPIADTGMTVLELELQDGARTLATLAARLGADGLSPRSIDVTRGGLDNAFSALTGKELRS